MIIQMLIKKNIQRKKKEIEDAWRPMVSSAYDSNGTTNIPDFSNLNNNTNNNNNNSNDNNNNSNNNNSNNNKSKNDPYIDEVD